MTRKTSISGVFSLVGIILFLFSCAPPQPFGVLPASSLFSHSVNNFRVFPGSDSFRLKWTNPSRTDISALIVSWDGYRNANSAGGAETPIDSNFTLITNASMLGGGITQEFVVPPPGSNITLDTSLSYDVKIAVVVVNRTSNRNMTLGNPARPRGSERANNMIVRRSLGTNGDNDEWVDAQDSCPATAAVLVSSASATDTAKDNDGDGCYAAPPGSAGLQSEDAFDNDPTENLDTDNDGIGDNSDSFPRDPNRRSYTVGNLNASLTQLGEVHLQWMNPDTGNSALKSFDITYSIANASTGVVPVKIGANPPSIADSVSTNYTIIVPGSGTYEFSIAPILKEGDRRRVAPANISIEVNISLPRVSGLSATPNRYDMLLSWTNPDANISSFNITYYELSRPANTNTISVTNGDDQVDTDRESRSSYTVRGLANGEYHFIVQPILGGGNRSALASVFAEIDVPPIRVRNLKANVVNNSISLSWQNPDADIVAFNITYSAASTSAGSTTLVDRNATNLPPNANAVYNISNLDNDIYDFFVTPVIDMTGRNASDTVAVSVIRSIKVDYQPPVSPSPPPKSGPDKDGDNIADSSDIDDDGDGLIEIFNATQLRMISNDLLGSSLNDGTTANEEGCGDNNIVLSCSGYELANDISLDPSGSSSNWDPIGLCSGNNSCPQSFNTTFEGNGYAINNISIQRDAADYGIGLFAAAGEGAEFRNLRLVNISIISNSDGNGWGALVGFANGIAISNVSVEGGSINTRADMVGGLAGQIQNGNISLASFTGEMLNGTNNLGGLVGLGAGSLINGSYASFLSMNGTNNVGGLVGRSEGVNISFSYVAANLVHGARYVGGLIGRAGTPSLADTNIGNSYVALNILSAAAGDALVDVIIGDSSNTTANYNVSDSYWLDSVMFPLTARSGNTTGGISASEITTPSSFTGIYANWGNAWCNPATGDLIITDSTPANYVRAWNLDDGDGANGDDYPVLNCLGVSTTLQRSIITRVLANQPPLGI